MPTLLVSDNLVYWPWATYAKIELRGQLTQIKVFILNPGTTAVTFDGDPELSFWAIMQRNRERLYGIQKWAKIPQRRINDYVRFPGMIPISIQKILGTKAAAIYKITFPLEESPPN